MPQSREYPNTEFLRVLIDRKTHQASVEIVVTDTYIDYAMHMLNEAALWRGRERKTVALSIGKQGSTCNMRDLFERKCTYQETVSFPVDMDAFRQAAAAYRPGKITLWRFQVRSKSGRAHARAQSCRVHAMAQAVDEALAKLR